MRHLQLTENGTAQLVELTPSEVNALLAIDFVHLSPTVQPGSWKIQTSRKVGVIQIGDLQITIAPKIGIGRLLFLLGYAKEPGWSSDHALVDQETELMPAVAEAFSRLASSALRQGLIHGYKTVEDSLAVVRGRIRENEQVRRRFGLTVPIEVRYDEYTADIAENQLLLGAVSKLLKVPRVRDEVRKALHHLRYQLSEVSEPVRGAPLPNWQRSRLNARYHAALGLAEIILAGDSFEQRVGGLTVTGIIFDMWRVYEDFVTVALGEAFAPFGGRVGLQAKCSLDEARAITMRPDFVWYADRLPLAVVDAKYKRESRDGFPDADIYQLLAYCTALGVSDGHLIYAKGFGEARTYRIRSTDIQIHCHTLDLEVGPDELLGQIGNLAAQIRQSGAHPPKPAIGWAALASGVTSG